MEKVKNYPNGLRLIVDYAPSFRSVAAGVWIGTGSRKESSANNGISHFIEHMVFKGTETMSPFDIANAFEKMGASVNAFTSKECTCYFTKSIDEHAEDCIDILSRIIFQSSFAKDELDKERKVIVEEINMVEDSPEEICYDLIAQAVYGENSLGHTILGPIDNILRFEKPDINEYMSQFYCPQNIVISLAGNITLEQADSLVKKYILPKMTVAKPNSNSNERHNANSVCKVRFKDFEQSNIAISYPSLPFNDKKFPASAILNIILGGGMSSRLFQCIREQHGLAYSVYTSPSAFVSNGTFNIYLNISAENTEKALHYTKNEIKKLLKDRIFEEEFARAKSQLKAASVFAQENPNTIMSSMGKLMILTGEVFDIDQRIKEYERVTIDEVNDLADSIFIDDKVCVAYVGKEIKADLLALVKE